MLMVAGAVAAWLGAAALTISELCTVKPSIDTIVRKQNAPTMYVTPLAQNDAPTR
jgi:hypothetical protein